MSTNLSNFIKRFRALGVVSAGSLTMGLHLISSWHTDRRIAHLRAIIRVSELGQRAALILLLLIRFLVTIHLEHELWPILVASKAELLSLSRGVLSLLSGLHRSLVWIEF